MINELELDPHFITTFPHCLRRSGAPNNRAKKPSNPSFARNLRGNFPSLHTSRSRPRNSGKWSRIYESWPHMDDATLRLCDPPENRSFRVFFETGASDFPGAILFVIESFKIERYGYTIACQKATKDKVFSSCVFLFSHRG